MATNLKNIRDNILRERGLTTTRSSVTKHKRIVRATDSLPFLKKTPLMRYLEVRHRQSIVDILASGSLTHIHRKYGVDRSTASKWKKRLMQQLLELTTG